MNAEDEDLDTTLSSDEMNVIRYVRGYVTRSLLKKHEKMTGDVHSQFITFLGKMAVGSAKVCIKEFKFEHDSSHHKHKDVLCHRVVFTSLFQSQ